MMRLTRADIRGYNASHFQETKENSAMPVTIPDAMKDLLEKPIVVAFATSQS